jgi:hypothetical protein
MRKELGKWLMDIAKYVTTAIFLTSILGDIREKWLLYIYATGTVLLCLVFGLLLIKEKR